VAPSERRTTLFHLAAVPVSQKKLQHHRLLPDRPLPPYSYVPGLFPHPESDPHGHSFELEHPQPPAPTETTWRQCEEYLWGIDLFNSGYYWEAHESWEQVWHACGRQGEVADFLKGLIKLAAAGVKAREGKAAGVERHARRAQELFEIVSRETGPDRELLGMSLPELENAARVLCENAQDVMNTSKEAVVCLMPFQLRVEGSSCRSK